MLRRQILARLDASAERISCRRTLWQFLRWSLPFLAAFLPILLLSVYAYRTSSDSVEHMVRQGNLSAAGNMAQLLTQDFQRSIRLAHAVAELPGTVEAVQARDDIALGKRLKAIVVSYPEIDRAYVTDQRGILWADFPPQLETYGKNLSDSDWYTGVSSRWQPYISAVHENTGGTSDSIEAAFAMPVQDGLGQTAGVLVFEINLSHLSAILSSVRPSRGGQTFIVDHQGTVVAHPLLDSRHLHREYADIPVIAQARAGTPFDVQMYADPVTRESVVGSIMPVSMGRHTWAVIAQQPLEEAYGRLERLKVSLSVGGGILTILTVLLVLLLARISVKNERLNRELQGKNQKLREVASIVASSNDAIIGLSPDGDIKTWNAGAQVMYGYHAERAVGQPFSMLIHPKQLPESERMLRKMKQGRQVKHCETVHVGSDGRPFHVSLTLSPVKDAHGKIAGSSAIARDITERKQIEQMKNDFISIVSHQLKAPVTAISWTIEGVLEGLYGKVTASLKHVFLDMQDVNRKSYQLISDILNVSRIERGVISVSLTPVSLITVAQAVAKNYRPAFAEKKLELRMEEQDKNVVVLGDEEKLVEAVGNSISNALKHTEKGSITLRISRKDGYGYVEVADTGKGMTPEILRKLFARDQILGGNASPENSAGLGLYIAKSFMKLQHGDVWAESAPGKGSTFVYKVPLIGGKKAKMAGKAESRKQKPEAKIPERP